MGGDHAPAAIVSGALRAARELDLELILTGPQATVEQELARHSKGQPPPGLRIVDAPEVIGMADQPVASIRSKRRSSIVVGLQLVARGEADGFVTAGNTGATMAAAVLELRRMPGIERPALATPFPTRAGPCLLLDVGANAEAKAQNLVQFAIMGSVYAERVLGLASPRVGLLNIGEEESKGSPTYQEAHQLLQQTPVAFIGNVEGKDIPAGVADVVVMDGFVGNAMIKLAEGIASNVVEILRSEIRTNLFTTVLGLAMLPVFRRVRRRLDYADYGGAPLLGVNGICIIGHGRSSPLAIENALRVASDAVRNSMLDHIRTGLVEAGSAVPREGLAN